MISSSARPRRRSRSVLLALLFVGGAVSCSRAPAPVPAPTPGPAPAGPTNGVDVLRAMHDRYATTWYRTLAFVQTTTLYRPNGSTLVQTWPEAAKIPGLLRIDTDTLRQGGVIYRRDSVYSFASGRLASADTGMNPLLILGFDVYGQPVDKTIAILRHLGFDLSKLSHSTWEGRPVYVVGATTGDTMSKQFWVDEGRLLFVRLIEPRSTPAGPTQDDIRFLKYVPHGGGWVAEEVMMYRGGKPRLHEVYANVQVNVPLDDGLFDPQRWSTVPHWFIK